MTGALIVALYPDDRYARVARLADVVSPLRDVRSAGSGREAAPLAGREPGAAAGQGRHPVGDGARHGPSRWRIPSARRGWRSG
jgi:hypothetical protein